MEELDPIIAEDEMEDDGIVVLQGADGEEIEFEEIASIVYNDGYYKVMKPVEMPEGMSEDEALVFAVTEEEEGLRYSLVLEDEIIDGVFAEYNALVDEAEAKQA